MHELREGDTARNPAGDVMVIDLPPEDPSNPDSTIAVKYIAGPWAGAVGLERTGDLEWIPPQGGVQ